MKVWELIGTAEIQGLDTIQNGLNKVGTGLTNLGSGITNLGTKLTGALSVPIAAVTALGIKYNATMQSLQTDFKVMLGSQEKAVAMTKKLIDMGASTPFESKDLAQATKILLAFGYTGEQVIPIMSRIGDVALGDNNKFQSLTRTMGQINALGKLQGGDLNQLINQGWNPLNEITKKTGETMEQVRDRMSKGKVAYKEVEQALMDVTSKGGIFYKGMDEGSKTFIGQLSTLTDTWNIFIGELTKPIFNELMKAMPKVIKFLGDISEKFKSLDSDTKTIILVIGGLVASIGPALMIFGTMVSVLGFVVTGLGALMSALSFLLTPVGIAGVAIAGLIGVLGTLVAIGFTVNDGVGNSFNSMAEKVRGAIEWVKFHIQDMKNAFTGLIDFLNTGNFDQSFDKLRSALLNMFPNHKKNIDDLLLWLSQLRDKALELKDWIQNDLIPTMSRWWDKIKEVGGEIKTNFTPTINALKELIKNTHDTITNFKGLMDQLQTTNTKTGDSFTTVKGRANETKSTIKDLADAVTVLVKGFNTIVGWIDNVVGALKAADTWCKNTSKSLTDLVNKVPLLGSLNKAFNSILPFAEGTNYAPGGWALVGEKGAELVNLPRGSKVYTANQTNKMLGNNSGSNLTSNVSDIVNNYYVSIDASELTDVTRVLDIFSKLGMENVARGGSY